MDFWQTDLDQWKRKIFSFLFLLFFCVWFRIQKNELPSIEWFMVNEMEKSPRHWTCSIFGFALQLLMQKQRQQKKPWIPGDWSNARTCILSRTNDDNKFEREKNNKYCKTVVQHTHTKNQHERTVIPINDFNKFVAIRARSRRKKKFYFEEHFDVADKTPKENIKNIEMENNTSGLGDGDVREWARGKTENNWQSFHFIKR